MKVYLGIPSFYGRPRIETLGSVASGVKSLTKANHEVEIVLLPDTWIAGARETICEAALEDNADWIVMTDDDMGFKGDLLLNLIQNDVDICAALAHKRRFPYDPVVFEKVLADDSKGIKGGYKHIYNLKRDLVNVDGVGMGVIAIKAPILKSMMKPWFATTNTMGEDLYFCSNARHHGFKVYYDGRLQATHFGDPIPVSTDWVMQIPQCPITLGEKDGKAS
jgi:hypothetical protein